MPHPASAAAGSSGRSPLEVLGNSLSDPVRRLGEVLAKKGEVQLVRRDDRVLEARVGSGGEAQAVAVHWNGEALVGTCSCPYHLARRQPCPHIWAAAVAAGRVGWSPWIVRPSEPAKTHSEERRARPAVRRGWRRTLDAIQTPPQDEPAMPTDWRPGRTLLYVVDVPATMESQQLTIEVLRRDLRRDGYPGRARRARIPYGALAALPDPADRTALAMLFGAAPAGLPSWADDAYRGNAVAATFRVPGPLHRPLIAQIAATGRAFLRLRPGSIEDRPLCWQERPWSLHLELRRRSGTLELGAVLRRGGERVPLSEPRLLLASGLAFFEDSVSPLAHHEAFGWISHLRRDTTIEVPQNDLEPLFDALDQQPRLPPLDLPADLALEEEDAEPVGRLRLALPSGGDSSTLEAELGFLYAGRPVEPNDPRTVVPDLRRRRLIRRQPEGEARALARLEELDLLPSTETRGWRLPTSQMPNIARTLLQEGWVVEAEGRRLRAPAPPRLTLQASVDWFELAGAIDFDGQQVALPELLAALAAKRPTVRLGDGNEGLLPEQWLERYAYLAGLGEVDGEVLRFGRSQLPLLDALLAESTEVAFDERSRSALSALDSGREPRPLDAPDGFQGVLRDYQRIGFGWLVWLTEIGLGGCLADDMGLGKTVQILALLLSRRKVAKRRTRSLVVVPRSVVFNWQQEARRFAPELTVATHLGPDRASRPAGLADAELLLTTYGTLRRDVTWLREVSFDVCVLDEAQAIKNPMTATAKAVRLIDASHRIALSGTPIENHLGELWSLFEFLNPGLLGASRTLRRAAELERDSDGRRLLSRTVRPLLLRRTKAEVAPELPERTELVLCCPLDTDQRRLYDELRDHYRSRLLTRPAGRNGEPGQMEVLEALLRLRQAACHPALLDPTRRNAGSAKLETLLPHLEEVVDEGHKALVYSQFTRFLALVREELDERGISYAYLDGQTRDRGAAVERFQADPDCRVFLISLKAGGLGLNLTAADYVFLLDPWWNPAAEAQAIDRAHRIGQERHVFAYRLIAEDTVEEKVLELQEEKRELAASVLGGDDAAGPLDLEALRQLLG